MDLEKRLTEALKLHKSGKAISSKPDIYKTPAIGQIRQTEYGPVWMVETKYDEGYLHGRVELARDISKSASEFFDDNADFSKIEYSKISVIDTETTGLAGGTGTYPFILGIGFWNDDQFVVRQYILRDFCEEPAQLSAFTDDIVKTNSLMSFNGKSFDIPLLNTRFRINRMPIPYKDYPHIDLLHPCRRLYRHSFESFKLETLEAMIVGFERCDDIPSHLIPSVFFEFLQCRDDRLLIPILNHNRDDIVSLYLLAQETAARIENAMNNCSNDDGLLLSMGRILHNRKMFKESAATLRKINRSFADEHICDDSVFILASSLKKQKRWEEAVEIWRQMINECKFGIYPYIELAKFQEHKAKEYHEALKLTCEAMKLTEIEREFSATADFQSIYKTLKRRLNRLQRKIT